MQQLARLFIALLLSGCATDGAIPVKSAPREPEVITLGPNHFAVRESFEPHVPTARQWAKRGEYGIPAEARRCGGPYYLYFQSGAGKKHAVVGVFVEGNKRLRTIEPDVFFANDIFSTPRLFLGAHERYGEVTPAGIYLLVTPAQLEALYECATRDEVYA